MAPTYYSKFETSFHEIEDHFASNVASHLCMAYNVDELGLRNQVPDAWVYVIPYSSVKVDLGSPGQRMAWIYNNMLTDCERTKARKLIKDYILGTAAHYSKNTRLESGTLRIAVDLKLWFAEHTPTSEEKKLACLVQSQCADFLKKKHMKHQNLKAERKALELLLEDQRHAIEIYETAFHQQSCEMDEIIEKQIELEEENEKLKLEMEELKKTEKAKRLKLLEKIRGELEFSSSKVKVVVNTLKGPKRVPTTYRIRNQELKNAIQRGAQHSRRHHKMSDIMLVEIPKNLLHTKFGIAIKKYLTIIPNLANVDYPLSEEKILEYKYFIDGAKKTLRDHCTHVICAISLAATKSEPTTHPFFCNGDCSAKGLKCIQCGNFEEVVLHYAACLTKEKVYYTPEGGAEKILLTLKDGTPIFILNIDYEFSFGMAGGMHQRLVYYIDVNIFSTIYSIWRADKQTKLEAISRNVAFHRDAGLLGSGVGLTQNQLSALCDAMQLYDSEDSLVLFRANVRSPNKFHNHEYLMQANLRWQQKNDERVQKLSLEQQERKEGWRLQLEEKREQQEAKKKPISKAAVDRAKRAKKRNRSNEEEVLDCVSPAKKRAKFVKQKNKSKGRKKKTAFKNRN